MALGRRSALALGLAGGKRAGLSGDREGSGLRRRLEWRSLRGHVARVAGAGIREADGNAGGLVAGFVGANPRQGDRAAQPPADRRGAGR